MDDNHAATRPYRSPAGAQEPAFAEARPPTGAARAPSPEPHIATVRTAVPLTDEERSRLLQALSRYVGRPVQIEAQLDADLLGGVWVRIGDIVIDGSLRGQLDALRDQLRAECRLFLATGLPPTESESRHE